MAKQKRGESRPVAVPPMGPNISTKGTGQNAICAVLVATSAPQCHAIDCPAGTCGTSYSKHAGSKKVAKATAMDVDMTASVQEQPAPIQQQPAPTQQLPDPEVPADPIGAHLASTSPAPKATAANRGINLARERLAKGKAKGVHVQRVPVTMCVPHHPYLCHIALGSTGTNAREACAKRLHKLATARACTMGHMRVQRISATNSGALYRSPANAHQCAPSSAACWQALAVAMA